MQVIVDFGVFGKNAIEINKNSTINQLKNDIISIINCKKSDFRLIFENKSLEYGKINDFNILNFSTIKCIFSPI